MHLTRVPTKSFYTSQLTSVQQGPTQESFPPPPTLMMEVPSTFVTCPEPFHSQSLTTQPLCHRPTPPHLFRQLVWKGELGKVPPRAIPPMMVSFPFGRPNPQWGVCFFLLRIFQGNETLTGQGLPHLPFWGLGRMWTLDGVSLLATGPFWDGHHITHFCWDDNIQLRTLNHWQLQFFSPSRFFYLGSFEGWGVGLSTSPSIVIVTYLYLARHPPPPLPTYKE